MVAGRSRATFREFKGQKSARKRKKEALAQLKSCEAKIDNPTGDCDAARPLVASVAQLVEQLTLNQLVPGSSPGRGTIRLAAEIAFGLFGGTLRIAWSRAGAVFRSAGWIEPVRTLEVDGNESDI
jgi:hypothetical protein